MLRLSARRFVNCIISGYNNDDLVGESSPRYKNDAFNYDFSHCLLNTPKPTKGEHFRNCLFEQDSPENAAKQGISTRVLICRSCCLPLHLTPNQRLSVQQILQ